jgi:hypothetical protein
MRKSIHLLVLVSLASSLLVACAGTPLPTPAPTLHPAPLPTRTPSPPPLSTPAPSFPAVVEPARYRRSAAPLLPRAESDQTAFLQDDVGLQTGPYRLEYTSEQFLIYPEGGDVALALTLPGGEALNVLGDTPRLETLNTGAGEQIVLTGRSDWGADFQATLYAYDLHPGLLRWRLEIVRNIEPPAGPEPELQFVDRATGEEASGYLEIYADRALMAAPHLYAYSAALDSTLFYWLDLTALNPFMEAAHYTPSATPRRRGQRLGHSFSQTDLLNQPQSAATTVYDSYLYLAPGKPSSEDAMFSRYLHNLGDIYDLIAVPDDHLFGWFLTYASLERESDDPFLGVQQLTIRDLANEKNWVTLDGKRYLRAYVADTRQSAEAISQLDVYTALTRYRARFGETPDYYAELRATIPDFFNPDFGPAGMFQNSGPLSVTGSQGRGDTWYELGHALKVAELALWDPDDAELRDLALRSGESWIDFAQTVDYRFPRFYSFDTWEGTDQEPDAGGGFAYFMLLLHDLAGDDRYVDQARNALHALDGHGFRLTYETHMTALAAAASARMHQIEPDPLYLDVINRAAANLMRLSWIWECDYGWMKAAVEEIPAAERWGTFIPRTFFGLNPTQQSAVITAKEQYEAWIYLTETLQRIHGQLDPTVEKLLAEFVKHTLLTIPFSLPPFLPAGVATEHPAAYTTVTENDLSLFIPLEDLRDGWDVSGAIGQEVYGAGMAPAMAALALVEVEPGLIVYSGYPLVQIEGTTVTFAGTPGTYTPVVVVGASEVLDDVGNPVDSYVCGIALCFEAEGGSVYRLRP